HCPGSSRIQRSYVALSCVSNEVGGDLVGNSAWGGVRLKDVLEAAGVRSGAMDVVFRAADGYSDSIPLELALDPSVLLAVSQNGEPLQQGHGFPCRVRIPAIYGMKNVKWLEEIEVVPTDFLGYWQKRGWSDVATVKTQARIDVAGDDGAASAGEETWVAGVAWAGDRKISKVEVSTDGGRAWAEAQLKQPLSDYSWRQWAFRWIPEASGTVEVMCRATDGTGETQTPDPVPPHPDGASGYHAVKVSVT
ncbi:MAG: molybdopterin-dependent oxidoreductase, partial [Actinomycetota bacterium]